MNSVKTDKLSLYLIVLSILLLFQSYYSFERYNGYNGIYEDDVAKAVSKINPQAEPSEVMMKPSGFFITEGRIIAILWLCSVAVSLLVVMRLLIAINSAVRYSNIESMLVLSVVLGMSGLYMFFDVGMHKILLGRVE